MNTSQLPKTRWLLVTWPILLLWIASAIYTFNSEWKEQAVLVLPIFMGATAFVVFLLHAVAGSIARRRHRLAALDAEVNQCMNCGATNSSLSVVDYHSYVFLIF